MLRAHDLAQWLDSVKPGRPASVFADDVGDTHKALEQVAESGAEAARVVTLSWRRVPALGNELRLLVSALANATLELYPSLYGRTQSTTERWTATDLETAAHEITRRIDAVSGRACRQILAACQKGRAPIVEKLSNSELVRQLALAIEPSKLFIFIAVHDAEAPKGSLRALAQGAEWLASNTQAHVILVLPAALSSASELDHVTYNACRFVSPEAPEPATRAPVSTQPRANTKTRAATEATVSVSPVIGRPHPKSAAEQLLHDRICSDAELRPLFAYNRPVKTRYQTNPIVDLLWEQGRLVIEIDGQDHCQLLTFVQDRRRDFELFMSGYRVIRFTRFKVLESPDQVLQDIREAVRLLQTAESHA